MPPKNEKQNAKHYNLNSKQNIFLYQGDSIESTFSYKNNCEFTYMDFSRVQITEFKKDPETVLNGEKAIFNIMKGKNSMIYIPSINKGDLDNGGSSNDILNNADSTAYTNLPNAVRTEQGTIIPQIIIPSNTYAGIQNGLINPIHSNDYFNTLRGNNTGFLWKAVAFETKAGADENAYNKVLKNKSVFGKAEQINGIKTFINNANAHSNLLDYPVIATRKYQYKLENSQHLGAFAFCYLIKQTSPGNVGTEKEKQMPAQILIKIPLEKTIYKRAKNKNEIQNQLTTNKLPYGEESVYKDYLQIQIPKKADIGMQIGILSKNKEINSQSRGAFGKSDNDFVPPQCKVDYEQEIMSPLLVYTTYNGIVLTNSIIKNALTGTEQIFLKNGNDDYKGEIQVIGAMRSNELKHYLQEDIDYDLKWFPTLFQEAQDKTSIELALRRPHTEQFIKNSSHDEGNKGDYITVEWIKCLGNFAMVPLFFHKVLEFSFFFKGEYQEQGKVPGNYYVYPVVNYIGNGRFKNNTKSDGKPNEKVYFGKIEQEAMGGGSTRAEFIGNDEQFREGIYRADFKYKFVGAGGIPLPRYPLEVLGAIVAVDRSEHVFVLDNENGDFIKECENLKLENDEEEQKESDQEQENKNKEKNIGLKLRQSFFNEEKMTGNIFDLISKLDISFGMDGVTGKLTLDGYACNTNIDNLILQQPIGEIDLNIKTLTIINNDLTENSSQQEIIIEENESSEINPNPEIFKGFAMQISRDGSENNYNIGISLFGAQRKMEDMKLVCAPFWDGDRLEMICSYFQNYMKLPLKMISSKVTSFNDALPVNNETFFSSNGSWTTNQASIITEFTETNNCETSFRVPRSVSWEKPAQNFVNGTSCLQALKKLAQDTSCAFVIGLDGCGYFYELDDMGIPYYVTNQTIEEIQFYASDIISINISPALSNKFNTIATFGFLQIKEYDSKTGTIKKTNSVQPGIQWTKLSQQELQDSNSKKEKFTFPWSRPYVSIEQGYFSNTQLLSLHRNKVKFAASQIYQGNMTVPGNTLVYHLYQKIKVCGIHFFVISIDHSIDLSSKQWTTTYGLNYFDEDEMEEDEIE